MEIFFGIVVAVVMIIACYFVNDTKKKHGVCCGKGCAGCSTYVSVLEEEIEKRKQQQTK